MKPDEYHPSLIIVKNWDTVHRVQCRESVRCNKSREDAGETSLPCCCTIEIIITQFSYHS